MLTEGLFRFCSFEQDVLEIFDTVQSLQMEYQTYRTGVENPYASGYVQEPYWFSDDRVDPEEEELARLEAQITHNEPESQDETQGLVDNPSYIDNDDQWHDTVEHRSSGIKDIIITGTVRLIFNYYSLPIRALCPC